jgi:N-hydroxyarylamine O-acetyltransferase
MAALADWSLARAPTAHALDDGALRAWCARVGMPPPPPPPPVPAPSNRPFGVADAALLARMVVAQSGTIPFENLDVTLRAHVALEPAALLSKLVARRRGGFCLENNGLLASALRAAGFTVRLRHARVWMRAASYTPLEPPMPRQHMVLVVRCDAAAAGEEFLVDAGFGGGGPAAPLLLAAADPVRAGGDLFRLTRGDAAAGEDSWILWGLQNGAWLRLYSFEHTGLDAPIVHFADFVLCSHFVQLAPGTLFHKLAFASLPTADGRITLVHRAVRRRGAEHPGELPAVQVTPLADARAYRAAAAEFFGIELDDAQAQVLFDACAPPA